jgi:hypothetical protein
MRFRVALPLVSAFVVTVGLVADGVAGATPTHSTISSASAPQMTDTLIGRPAADPMRLPPRLHPLAISAIDADDAWLAGRPAFGPSPAVFVHWDGTRWRRFSTPHFADSTVSDLVAVNSHDVWAVGEFGSDRLLHWNGVVWRPVQIVGLPPSAKLVSVAASGPSDVWAVGQRDIGSRWMSFVVHWDGKSWSVVSTWRPPLGVHTDYEAVSAGSSGDVWVSGFRYNTRSGIGQSIVDHWNGRSWARVRGLEDIFSEGVHDVTTVAPDDVWVVGSRSVTGGEVPMAEHWDGSTWTLEPTPTPGINSGIERISAVSPSDVWAVGWIFTRRRHPSTFEPLALHWDGAQWLQTQVVGGRSPRDSVTGLSALSATDVWLCGASGGHPLVRHWDGTGWS